MYLYSSCNYLPIVYQLYQNVHFTSSTGHELSTFYTPLIINVYNFNMFLLAKEVAEPGLLLRLHEQITGICLLREQLLSLCGLLLFGQLLHLGLSAVLSSVGLRGSHGMVVHEEVQNHSSLLSQRPVAIAQLLLKVDNILGVTLLCPPSCCW